MSTDDHHGCSTSRSVLPPTLLERGDGSGEVRLRVARNSQPDSEASCADHSRGGSPINQGGVLRKKLYDQNVADWSARYKKNKQTLENLKQDCEVLRSDVAKQQQEVDERAETFRQLDDRYSNEVVGRAADAKESYESAVHLRGQLQVQLSEYRKTKTHLVREKKFLTADYERKHSELMRTAEARDKLDTQLAQLAAQLGQVSAERRRMERELDLSNTVSGLTRSLLMKSTTRSSTFSAASRMRAASKSSGLRSPPSVVLMALAHQKEACRSLMNRLPGWRLLCPKTLAGMTFLVNVAAWLHPLQGDACMMSWCSAEVA